jgi:hypothetical protein
MRRYMLAPVGVLAGVVALALLGGAAKTGAATRATGIAQQTTAYFKPYNDPGNEASEANVCFRGDFPTKVSWDGQVKFDLPVTLVVTVKDVRRSNDFALKSKRLPGSQRAYHFNPKDYGWQKRISGAAFYDVYPTGVGARPCSSVDVGDYATKAGFGKSFITTGTYRIRVASSGEFLGDSLWKWKIEAYGGSLIWEGTDNFINICIDDNKEIRSRAGRLYCLQEPGTFYKITQVR